MACKRLRLFLFLALLAFAGCNGSRFAPVAGLRPAPVLASAFSPGMAWLSLATEDGLVRLWDVRAGSQLVFFQGEKGDLTLEFGPGLASLSAHYSSGAERAWDISAFTLPDDPGGVFHLRLEKDGAAVLFDTAAGKEKFRYYCFSGEGAEGAWLCLEPGGFFNASVDESGVCAASFLTLNAWGKRLQLARFSQALFRPGFAAGNGKKDALSALLSKDAAPPSPHIGETAADGGQALVTVTVTERAGGTGIAALYRKNAAGREIPAGFAAPRIENGEPVFRAAVPLEPGENRIGVSVFNRNNTAESEIVWTSVSAVSAFPAVPAKPLVSAFPGTDFPFIRRPARIAERQNTAGKNAAAASSAERPAYAVSRPSSAGLGAVRAIRPGFVVYFGELNPANYRVFNPDVLAAMGMERYEIAYLAGRDAFRNGEYDRAIAEYGASIRLNSAFALAYAARGVAWAGKNNLDRAIEDYNRALYLDSAYAEVYNYRGFAWADKGEPARALEDYSRALRCREDYADAWYNRACVWADMGEYDRAAADFTRVIELESRNAAAYNRRGAALYGAGDNDRAIGDFTEAIRLKADSAVYYYNRGNAWYAKGDYERALADLNRALSLDGKFAAAYRSRAKIWRSAGDEAKALTDSAAADRL